MTIRIVPTQFSNIAAAISAASPGDTIQLQAGYTESGTVSVTKENLFFTGDTTNTGIHLALGTGITAITLQGTAPFAVDDNSGDNTITGNGGDNVIKVTAGTDHVDAGSGNDTLVVDYSALTHNINTLSFTTGNTDGYQATYYDGTGNQVSCDILWHNDSGAVAIWDSAQIGHQVAAAGTVTSDWHIIG